VSAGISNVDFRLHLPGYSREREEQRRQDNNQAGENNQSVGKQAAQ